MIHAKMLLAKAFPSIAPAPSDLLLDWRRHIKDTFPSVQHISCDDLQVQLRNQPITGQSCQPPLLLDFRTQSEHLCSHIAGSIRMDPDASAADIVSLLLQRNVAVAPSGNPFSIPDLDASCSRFAVFYCSIGYRSSAAAARVLLSEVMQSRRSLQLCKYHA